MPRRKPISPTVAPMYEDSRAPGRQHQQNVAGPCARGPAATKHDRADVAERRTPPSRPRARRRTPTCAAPPARTRAPTPPPVAGMSAVADAGDPHLLARRGRRATVSNRCARQPVRTARRAPGPRRSTAGPPVEVSDRRHREHAAAPGPGGSTSAAPPSRRAAGATRTVANTDMYMWSRTKTWSRSTDEPVQVLGPLVVGDRGDRACSRATCASRAIVTLSRNRRCTRVLTTLQEPGRHRRDAQAR